MIFRHKKAKNPTEAVKRPSESIAHGEFFTFLTTKPTRASATKGAVSIWINGPSTATDLLDLYTVYKEECCRYMDAASSFVLYDAEKGLILAARDFFGAYPLYYTQIDTQFIFSFSVRAIVESGRFTPQVNPVMIADYLNWESSNKPINNQTFYQHLFSLLPGHRLLSEKGEVIIKPYSRLDLEKYARLSDDGYLRNFSDFFIKAVRKTVEPYQKVASHLSGGLDSSSVCNVAQSFASEPIHSFYIHTNTPTAQEGVYVEATLEKWQQQGRPLHHQNITPDSHVYDTVVKTTTQIGQPSQLLLPVSTFLPIIEQAQQEGCDVLLSGHCGDQVVGYGFDYLDNLFQQREWKTLKTAIDQYADQRVLQSLSPQKSFKTIGEKRRAYALQFFAQKLRHSQNLRLWQQASVALVAHFHCGVSDVFNFFRARKKHHKEVPIPRLKKWLRDDWQPAKPTVPTHELDSMQLVLGTPTTSQQEQINFFYSSLGIQYNEEIDQLHACYSLATAHPFLDKNLLELNLNTPSRLRFGNGFGRGVLRQGLKDYLPETITHRIDKGEFSDYAHRAFGELYSEFMKRTDADHPIWEIVDKNTFDNAIRVIFDKNYTIKQKNPHRFVASRVIYLAIWLDYLNTISS